MITPVNILAGHVDIEADFGSGFETVGFTQDGLTVEFESNVELIHVDQVAVPVHPILGAGKVKLSVILAEVSFLQLKLGIPGLAEITADMYAALGSPDDDTQAFFAIQFTGEGPNGTTWTFEIPNATATGSGEQVLTRTDIRKLPVDISAQSNGTDPLWTLTEV
jgi:hypothetical protein